jgi:hypothetical protein
MKHTIQKIKDTLDVLTFEDTATNHEDGRKGSALAVVSWANEQAIGGHDDWALPSKETLLDLCQLMSISDRWYWSSSPNVGDSSYAWGVYFGNGDVSNGSVRSSHGYVRLVRASQLFDIGLAALKKRFGAEE